MSADSQQIAASLVPDPFFIDDSLLSLHDALPISIRAGMTKINVSTHLNKVLTGAVSTLFRWRSEEHTSELQSRGQLVCRLLLEKTKERRSTRAWHGLHRRRPRRLAQPRTDTQSTR